MNETLELVLIYSSITAIVLFSCFCLLHPFMDWFRYFWVHLEFFCCGVEYASMDLENEMHVVRHRRDIDPNNMDEIDRFI